MPYIGAQPTTTAFITDTFNGNGSTTAFTMSTAPATTTSILVAVSGVLQDPSTYSVSGTTLTFSAAPPSGTGNISVRFLGIPASGVVTTAYRTQTEFTATAGQTTFSVPSYTVGYIDVYRNGALLGSADFTATSGTTVVLTNAANAGDLVETVSFYVSSVVNAIPAVAGAVNSTYLLDGAVTKAKMAASGAWAPAGTVIQVVQATTATQVTTAAGPVDTGLSASITPTSATSKILVLVTQNFYLSAGGNDVGVIFDVFRGATKILAGGSQGFYLFAASASPEIGTNWNTNYLDSPATTSATTYKVQMTISASGGTVVANWTGNTSTIILMEIAA
jgi:hypothetical protein